MFHLKDIEYKRSTKKKELEGIISQLKEEMPLIIANVLKLMGFLILCKHLPHIVPFFFQYNQYFYFCYFLEVVEISDKFC